MPSFGCFALTALFSSQTVYVFASLFGFPQVSKAACILTTQVLTKILRSKEAAATVNIKTWPIIIDTGNTHQSIPNTAPVHNKMHFVDIIIGSSQII